MFSRLALNSYGKIKDREIAKDGKNESYAKFVVG